jgi:hypothetical protein
LWLKDDEGKLGKCGNSGIKSWEVPLSNDNHSNEKTPEPAAGKKIYKTPSLRFESVFEVSALSCGKVTSTQSSCKLSMKAS